VKSLTHKAFGRGALNCRLTRSRGHASVADGRPDALAANHTLQAHLPHQPGDRAARNIDPFTLQLAPDLAHPIDPEVFRKDPADLVAEFGIPALAGWSAVGIGLAGGVLVVG
jgi:hypothetical protein